MWSIQSNVCVILAFTLYSSLFTNVSCDLSYGEKCEYESKTMVCNRGLSLYCSATGKEKEGVCRCPDTMYWDVSRNGGDKCPGSCVSMVGEECLAHPRNGTELKIECVANANCRRDPETKKDKCFCRSGFQKTAEGDCLPTVGGVCSDDQPCNYASFLKCSANQTCICDMEDPTVQMWDKYSKQCVGLVGGDCDLAKADGRNCIRHAVCNSGTCECDQNYALNTENNHCVVPLGGACERTDDCGPTLTCQAKPPEPTSPPTTPTTTPTPTTTKPTVTTSVTTATTKKASVKSSDRFVNSQKRHPSPNDFLRSSSSTPPQNGTCRCNEITEHYDGVSQKCQILVHQTCLNKKRDCVQNSECITDIDSNSDKYGQCICKKMFVPANDYKNCAGDYGATCKKDEANNIDCFTEAYLTCNTNTSSCVCMDGYEYDPKTKKCIGYVGSKCQDQMFCNATTAHCADDGKCACKEGYSQFPNDKLSYKYCLASNGTTCSAEIKCNGDEFLNCNNGTCQCEELSYFDSSTRKCIGMVGANCGDLVLGLRCVPNASCVASKDNSKNKLCTCDQGFSKTDENRCKENGAGSRQFDIILMVLALFLSFVVKANKM